MVGYFSVTSVPLSRSKISQNLIRRLGRTALFVVTVRRHQKGGVCYFSGAFGGS